MSGETNFVAFDAVAIVGLVVLVGMPAAVALWRAWRDLGRGRRPE